MPGIYRGLVIPPQEMRCRHTGDNAVVFFEVPYAKIISMRYKYLLRTLGDPVMVEPAYLNLAMYHTCVDRLRTAWPQFLETRKDRLRHGDESEKVAEAIIEDLLTGVLDWEKGDLAYQLEYADIVLSQNLQKHLVIEVKKPGTLRLGRQSLAAALEQARRYAAAQHINRVAVTDGCIFYAADINSGGLQHRVAVNLGRAAPPEALWWISVHGVYRPFEGTVEMDAVLTDDSPAAQVPALPENSALLHPKYKLPVHCFAWVGDAGKPATWKLPYLKADGTVDDKRLPKAIQCLLSNFRGTKVKNIPESDVSQVLLRLARCAKSAELLPPESIRPAPVYQQLVMVLEQNNLLSQLQAPTAPF